MQAKRTRDAVAMAAAMSALTGCAATATDDTNLTLTQEALRCQGVTENPAANSADWPSAGHDWSHTGHNAAEREVGVDNVNQLTVAWQHEFSPAPSVKVPVVSVTVAAEGVAYIADMGGFVHARDLETGAPLWTSFVSQAAPDPVFSSVIQAGPVVTDDALYVGDAAATIHRIDLTDGSVDWSTVVDANPLALIQGDLATFGDNVLFGVSSFENATVATGDLTIRGSVAALDRDSGSLAWKTYTTSDQSLASPKWGAGVGVWSSPAIDPKRGGHLFIGTGQHYEYGSDNPSPGSENDLDLSDSLLSLSLHTGELKAQHQFTVGDVFGLQNPEAGPDFDVGTPPNLFEIQDPNGRGKVAVVGVGDKAGIYRVMYRYADPKKRCNKSSSQNWCSHAALEVIWQKQIALGSVVGGFQATAAYADGIVYVAAHELIDGRSIQDVVPAGQSATWLGTPEGFQTVQNGSRTNIMALNTQTGDVIWETKTFGAITFAPLILANGVLYQGDVNGKVRAFAADSGAPLWQSQLGGFPVGQAPDGQPIFAVGHMITGISFSRGRLMVSYLPLLPAFDPETGADTGVPVGVTAFGLPN